MKRRCILPALVALCLLLSACGSAAGDTALPSQWPDKVVGGMADAQQDRWTYQLSAEVVHQEYRDPETQRLLASGDYAVPKMTVYHADGSPYDEKSESMSAAVRTARRFNQYFEKWLADQQANLNEIAVMAGGDYHKQENELWEQTDYYYLDEVQATFWNNDHIACVTLWSNSFTGGAHHITGRTAVTFDMSSGETVTINDIVADYAGLRDAVALDILSQIQNGKWVKYYDGDVLFSDYEETIPEWMSRALFFGDGQMTVVFSAYDIAPYSAGEQAFDVSYDLIAPYLNDYGRELLEIT